MYSALILLVLVSPCAAQTGRHPDGLHLDTPQAYGRRTDAFRRLLFEFHFQPLEHFADLQKNPDESLFIMLGDPSCLSKRNFLEGLRAFVDLGGAVLIATDKQTVGEAGENLGELAGVQVTEETLVVSRHYIDNQGSPLIYDNSEYCPFVQPLVDSTTANGSTNVLGAMAASLGAGGRPDLFRRGPQPDQPQLHVATNAPSRLMKSKWVLPFGVHRLAVLPRFCQDENPQVAFGPNGPRFVDSNGPLFAVGGTVGKGRVLVLADHSIFINRMILPHDNGNMEFAANCLHWLRGGVSSPMEALRAGPDGLKQLTVQRNKVLLWDDGKVRTDFEVPLKKVSLPPTLASEPAIVAAIDKTIAKLEDDDFFNRQLFASMDDAPGGRKRVFRNGVYLLTLAVFLLLAYLFLWRTRHRPEFAAPLLADAVRKLEPKGSLLDQRRRALMRMGNFWEMGHRLARECFESAGVALTGAAPPRVEMKHGRWRQRLRLRRSVARLWRLANRDAPVPLAPTALQYRLHELEELKTALADGTIRLTQTGARGRNELATDEHKETRRK